MPDIFLVYFGPRECARVPREALKSRPDFEIIIVLFLDE